MSLNEGGFIIRPVFINTKQSNRINFARICRLFVRLRIKTESKGELEMVLIIHGLPDFHLTLEHIGASNLAIEMTVDLNFAEKMPI